MLKIIHKFLFGNSKSVDVKSKMENSLSDDSIGCEQWLETFKALNAEINRNDEKKVRLNGYFTIVQGLFLVWMLLVNQKVVVVFGLFLLFFLGFMWCREICKNLSMTHSLWELIEVIEKKLNVMPHTLFRRCGQKTSFYLYA